MKAMRLFVFVCGCLLATVAPGWAGVAPPFDLPNNDAAADPMVLQVDGVYYLYVTTSWDEFETWTSTDLLTWEYGGVIFSAGEAGAWNDGKLWAPEVHTDGEQFYLYYSANMHIGVAVSQSPAGPFVDVYDHPFVGDGYGGVQGLAIDGHVFLDEDGRRYFYYAGYAPFSVVRGVEMTSMTTLAEADHPILVEPGIFNWELFVTEAPWMVKHDGGYYLMYSGYGADRPDYAIGYATAGGPLGDFVEYALNPIFHRDDAAGIYGPGHHCVVEDPGGRAKVIYHTKQEAAIGWDREIRAADLCFTAGGRLYVGLDGCTESDLPADDDDDTTGGDDDSFPIDGEDSMRGVVDEDDDDCCGAA
ncbi:MAG: glycoside hydrolase family 43 protein [Candidatus Lernaella stagnicola]|nr:glycoside hydrolase family 43 protein [Candidatus Lernaella stagnicola]